MNNCSIKCRKCLYVVSYGLLLFQSIPVFEEGKVRTNPTTPWIRPWEYHFDPEQFRVSKFSDALSTKYSIIWKAVLDVLA